MTQSPAPGWYPDGSGATRWWDGSAWTEHVQPAADQQPAAPAAPEPEPAPALPEGALMQAKSHIAGKNALVTVYPDRIEWERTGLMVLGHGASEVIPIRAITSVSAKRGGALLTGVVLNTAGGKIEVRLGNKDVDRFKQTVTDLVIRA